jgi:hypothetical protein
VILHIITTVLACLIVGSCGPDDPMTAGEDSLTGPYLGQAPPGTTPVLFAPDFFQDPGEYHSPVVFSPDGTEAYWTPMPGHGPRNTTLMSRMVDGVWTSQSYVDFGLEAGATEVVFSPDGGTIYFLSRQMLEGEQSLYPPEDAPERIWYATRTSDGIGQPQLISEVITAHRTHWQFSVAASGDLYFTSHNPEVRGFGDIYVAEFDGTTYLEPQPLGLGINSDIRESCPFIAPDESYLIFTRDDQRNGYNPDLFISYRSSDGSWIEAERLPSPINTDITELYPVVTPDGEYLFFLSWRGGAGRIFWVDAGFLRREIR